MFNSNLSGVFYLNLGGTYFLLGIYHHCILKKKNHETRCYLLVLVFEDKQQRY